VEIASAMTALAQRNLLEALVGPVSGDRFDAFVSATLGRRRAIERIFLSISPYPEYLPTAANLAYVRGTRRLAAAFEADLQARRRKPSDDLLSLLMAARYDDGRPMSDGEVLSDALMLALTGYDNVSETLIWTLYLLGENPDADARLAAEARARGDAYVTRVVRESLRIFPPTWMFVRVARVADTLPSGAAIPVGAKVYLSPYVIQRSPRHWPEPDRFAPERFAEAGENGLPRYAYFPFGGGPHVCIGETLAIGQVVTVLGVLARRVRLSLAPGEAVVPEGGLKLRPKGGLRMVVEPRRP
jgi:cytochrome P450